VAGDDEGHLFKYTMQSGQFRSEFIDADGTDSGTSGTAEAKKNTSKQQFSKNEFVFDVVGFCVLGVMSLSVEHEPTHCASDH
jgi:hypothetical protein